MAGIMVITKKEIADAVSNRAFVLSLGVLVFTLIFSGYTSALSYVEYRGWMGDLTGSYYSLSAIGGFAQKIGFLGELVAIAYGFNVVNKERTQGSMKVLLSYPIYRDKVILGKMLAGVAVSAVVSAVSLMISLGIFLAYTQMLLTFDMILRIFIFTIFTIMFLSAWIGLSMLLSQIFGDAKTTLMLMLFLSGLSNSNIFAILASTVLYAIFGPNYNSAIVNLSANASAVQTIYSIISALSPSQSYQTIAYSLSTSFMRTFVGNEIVYAPYSLWDFVVNEEYYIAGLVIFTIITLVGNYVVFTRRDVT